MKPDLFDIFVFIGLLIAATGLWMLSPPIALILVGVFIMLFGFMGAASKRKEDKGYGDHLGDD